MSMKPRRLPKLFPILAAGSLGLAVAVAVLWVVSYWRLLEVSYAAPTGTPNLGQQYGVAFSAGAMLVGKLQCMWGHNPYGWWTWSRPARRGGSEAPWREGLWFASVRIPGLVGPSWRIPLWFPLLLSLILPAVWLRRFRSERRKKREGLCRSCGYDLRVHSPGQVCPECGSAVPGDLVRKSLGQR